MNSQQLEVLALAVSEMNSATNPKSEAFAYRNPGKLRAPNGDLRNFSTWSGGLKSLISDISRFDGNTPVLEVFKYYGGLTIEREFLALDFLTQALGFTVGPNTPIGAASDPQES